VGLAWAEDALLSTAPLRDLTEPLSAAKFLIERISEPIPSDALKSRDPQGYDQRSRVPAFIFVRARKGE
jgi:hypothetical protein